MSYTIGAIPKTETEAKPLHSIPCKLDFNGPADVDGKFVRHHDENEKFERAVFRGRGLEGAEFKPSPGYAIFVLKPRKGPKGEILDIEAKASKIQIWEWDRQCGDGAERTIIAKAAKYLKIADSISYRRVGAVQPPPPIPNHIKVPPSPENERGVEMQVYDGDPH
ncbi:unnamed protein product [Caenorhabditis bovis]|uniref:Uncharacterized protein n=1 Tax=Caenorhabditis bovis TaxID=2654633 RepID=A0A8S1EUU6_9PELO|nr:unnamed protein product [Caenorhabditis bovis]